MTGRNPSCEWPMDGDFAPHWTNGESTTQHCKRFISNIEVTESEFGELIPTEHKGKPSEWQEKGQESTPSQVVHLGP